MASGCGGHGRWALGDGPFDADVGAALEAGGRGADVLGLRELLAAGAPRGAAGDLPSGEPHESEGEQESERLRHVAGAP